MSSGSRLARLFLLVLFVFMKTNSISADAALPTVQARTRFLSLTDFSSWQLNSVTKSNTKGGAVAATKILTYLSPEVSTVVDWDELIVSWNTTMPFDGALHIEARGIFPDRATKYYTLAKWSADGKTFPRESVNEQKDDDGNVLTDTLVLKRHGAKLQLRISVTSDATTASVNRLPLKFVGLSFLDSRMPLPADLSSQATWGKTVGVPVRFQSDYEGGSVYCSPTSVSMILSHWSQQLARPELDKDVPEVVAGVFDPNWPGTGNWPFNTAYAGSFDGMRAYVTRFDSLAEVEEWIDAGVPVALSISYNLLKGKGVGGSGHLVVCTGFKANGDVVLNDPGKRLTPEQLPAVFSRELTRAAWAHSKNTVYLIFPDSAKLPINRLGHF